MLFNTQEHTFNINEIEELLFEMGLKFCGFTGFGNSVNKKMIILTNLILQLGAQ